MLQTSGMISNAREMLSVLAEVKVSGLRLDGMEFGSCKDRVGCTGTRPQAVSNQRLLRTVQSFGTRVAGGSSSLHLGPALD